MRSCSPNQFGLIRVGSIWFEFVQLMQFDLVLSWCGSMWFASIWFVFYLSWVYLIRLDSVWSTVLRYGLIHYWVDLIPCCSNRSDSIRCYSVSIGSIWFHLIQPSLVWSYFTRLCVSVFLIWCVLVQCASGQIEFICFYMIWCCLIRFDEVLFDLIPFDLIPCHVIQFDSWCFGSMWFDLGSIHVIWFHSVWLDLTQCIRFIRLDLFCSVSMRFNLIHVYLIVFGSIWFGLIRCDPIHVWRGLCWLDFTRLGLTRFHSVWSRCLQCWSIWFDSSACGSILFDLLWFGSFFCFLWKHICFCDASSFSHVL